MCRPFVCQIRVVVVAVVTLDAQLLSSPRNNNEYIIIEQNPGLNKNQETYIKK